MADQNPSPEHRWRWTVGQRACWLRDHWVLTIISFLAAIALALVPVLDYFSGPGLSAGVAWSMAGGGGLAALSVVLDSVADSHMKRVAELEEQAEHSAANTLLTALLGFLEDVLDRVGLESSERHATLGILRAQLAQSAATASVAANVRASCYRLTQDADGWRTLSNPKSRGRVDQASTEFVERDDPDHPIWKMMSACDADCAIYNAPNQYPRVDWANKPYKTFVSVPIHVDKAVFGMLSVNAPHVGDLSEVDRLAAIAMARTMAVTLAMVESACMSSANSSSSSTLGVEQGGSGV